MKDNYRKLIDYIKLLEKGYIIRINNWKFEYKFNLKKTQVRNFLSNKELQLFTIDYIEKFKGVIKKELNFKIDGLSIEYRLKNINSIYDKIYRYNDSKEKGRIPILKCLNDLMGIRFIIEDIDYYDFIIKEIENNFKSERYRFINSSKNGYKAYHLYIKIDNNMFPFEIQFWKKVDEESNKKFHQIHKQLYIYIEKDMNKDEVKKEGV